MPSGSIKDNVASPVGFPLLSTAKSVASVSSTVTTVVEATADNLPPLLTPALTGSFISIIAPGLTTAPESIDVEKTTTSDSFCSANNTAFPNLLACPLDVQANAFICFTTVPIRYCSSILYNLIVNFLTIHIKICDRYNTMPSF